MYQEIEEGVRKKQKFIKEKKLYIIKYFDKEFRIYE